MLDRVISQSSLLEVVEELSRTRRIIGPVKRNGHFFYQPVDGVTDIDLGFTYCVYSPKQAMFPAHETLFSFDRTSGSFETSPVLHDHPTAIVGAHPCDVNAIRLLDRVFAQAPADEHYAARRRNTLIVGVDCPGPCTEGVFCRDMRGNVATEGFDLMCYPISGTTDEANVRYGVVFGTNVGRELIVYSQVGERPTVQDERAMEQYQRRKSGAFPRMIANDVDSLPELLDRSYDSLLWEATARRCYSCGSCNLSCPTCYCFNIYDDVDISQPGGSRNREWDGCQLRDFAEVAGGHNFRTKAASRLRHRIYRKAKWIKERELIPGCVGCARCDRACTARINSVEIYNQLAEEG